MRSRLFLWPLFRIIMVLALSSPVAYAQVAQNESLEQRILSLEQKLNQLEKRVADALPQENAPASASSAPERLDALDQKLRILERNRQLEKEEAAAKSKQSAVVGAGKDGFFLKSADSTFQLKLSGYVQADGRFYADDTAKASTDSFTLRRVRPIFQGTVFKYVDFRIMPDFGEGKTVLQDAHVDLRFVPAASFRAGKFKSPFGLERLQSGADLLFVERALPTSLAPNRDEGVQVYGDVNGGSLSYAAGVFNGTVDGGSVDVDNNDGKDYIARIFSHPFAKTATPLKGLGVGVAYSTGDQEGALPSFKTAGQATFFSYVTGVTAAGRRVRYSPQAYYYQGPLGILAEYVQSEQYAQKGTTRLKVRNHAWQVSGSYLLTCEKKGYKGISPRRVFEGAKGGFGAWEVAVRFGELSADGTAFANGFADPAKSARTAKAWAVGLNWYLNKYAKLVFNYEQTHFTGGAARGADRPTEKAFLNRLQVAF